MPTKARRVIVQGVMEVGAPRDALRKFYDDKYPQAAGTPSVPPIRLVKFPADRFEMTLKLASMDARGRYLEIGAGSGGTVNALLDRYDKLVALELSSERARSMEKLFQAVEKVRVICADIEAEDTSLLENYYDTVAMNAVIEHLVDPLKALKKIRRLLKPSGRLILCTPNVAKWTRRIKLLFGYFPSTASLREGFLCYDRQTDATLHDEGHLHYFTFRSLASACMRVAGFSRVERYGFGRSFLSRAWPTLFSDVFIVAYK